MPLRFCPTAGPSQARSSAYERLLDEIGLSDHAVIAESRAALLYARDSGEVDVMGNSEAADHGNVDLGAPLIDREIQRRAVDVIRTAQS